jgi:hypothetical protein
MIESFTALVAMDRHMNKVLGTAAKAKFGDNKWQSTKQHPWLLEEKPRERKPQSGKWLRLKISR